MSNGDLFTLISHKSSGRAILTAKKAEEIRAAFKARKATLVALSIKYRVSIGCIRDVVTGRTWKPESETSKATRKRNGKMRYSEGDKLNTMEILEITKETKSYKTTIYRVRLVCGCDKSELLLDGHQIYGREKRSPGVNRSKEFRCQNCRSIRPRSIIERDKQSAIRRRERSKKLIKSADWALSLMPANTRNRPRQNKRVLL